jgi:hypothetical protein
MDGTVSYMDEFLINQDSQYGYRGEGMGLSFQRDALKHCF